MAKNILIVDDAAFMRMMIKDILTKNGYNVIGEAENGAKAFEKYNELKPDLVLMDITMPEVDGIAALKKIKGADPNALHKFLTSHYPEAEYFSVYEAGFCGFWIHYRLTELGIHNIVVNPAAVPTMSYKY